MRLKRIYLDAHLKKKRVRGLVCHSVLSHSWIHEMIFAIDGVRSPAKQLPQYELNNGWT